jgi:tol-pal system protein YbgF
MRNLLLLITIATLLSGCLARSTGPGLPFVQPAQSGGQMPDPGLAHIAGRMEEVEREIQRLRAQIENMEANGAPKRELNDLQERISLLEKKVGIQAKPAPESAGAQTPEPPKPDTAQSAVKPQPEVDRRGANIEIENTPINQDEKMFRDALQTYNNGGLDKAAGAFEEFLTKFAQSPLASDAVYWIGEIRMNQGKYEEAVLQFDRVVKEFPGSKKELDAYLKQAQSFEKMGDSKSAKYVYQKIVNEHPHTTQGRHAAAKLKAPAAAKREH